MSDDVYKDPNEPVTVPTKFKCWRCGACCQSIGGVEGYETLDDGTGTCIHFDRKTRNCQIYENRPLLCNVWGLYHELYEGELTEEEYAILNLESCRNLRANLGLPEPEVLIARKKAREAGAAPMPEPRSTRNSKPAQRPQQQKPAPTSQQVPATATAATQPYPQPQSQKQQNVPAPKAQPRQSGNVIDDVFSMFDEPMVPIASNKQQMPVSTPQEASKPKNATAVQSNAPKATPANENGTAPEQHKPVQVTVIKGGTASKASTEQPAVGKPTAPAGAGEPQSKNVTEKAEKAETTEKVQSPEENAAVKNPQQNAPKRRQHEKKDWLKL